MNSRKWSKGLALAGTALIAGGIWGGTAQRASATPAGLTFYPATDIYGKGVIHFDADLFASTNGKTTTLTSEGLSYGFGPDKDKLFGRTEIGFDYVSSGLAGTSESNRLLFNLKTQLYNNPDSGLRLVAGVWGLGSRGDVNNGRSVFPPDVGYLLGSKTFGFGRIHLGIAHSFAKRDIISAPNGDDDRTYLQLGYDKVFLDGKLQFTADYYSGKSAASVFAPGLIYYVNDKADFQLGYIRYNSSSFSPRNQIYVGFDYNFGSGAATPTPPSAAPEDATKQPAAGGATPDRPST